MHVQVDHVNHASFWFRANAEFVPEYIIMRAYARCRVHLRVFISVMIAFSNAANTLFILFSGGFVSFF